MLQGTRITILSACAAACVTPGLVGLYKANFQVPNVSAEIIRW